MILVLSATATLLAQVAIFLSARFVLKRLRTTTRNTVGACVLLILIEILAHKCDISFSFGPANLFAVLLAIFAYCALFISCTNISLVPLRHIARLVMLMPIGCVILFFPLFLMFAPSMVFEMMDSGHGLVTINTSYECRTKEIYGLFDRLDSVTLYRHWHFLPFVEYEVAKKWRDINDNNAIVCNDVIKEYVQAHPDKAGDLKIETTGK